MTLLERQLAASIRLAQSGELQKAVKAKRVRQVRNARRKAWRDAR